MFFSTRLVNELIKAFKAFVESYSKIITTIIILFNVLFCTGCQSPHMSNPEPTVLFAGLSFSLPGQPKVIAMPNGRGDFLVFKYSNQRGKDYLAFSQEAVIDNSCSSEAFFQAVVNPAAHSLCNTQAVRVFTQQFADQHPAELWPSAEHNAYYFQSNDQRRFVFIPLAADQLLKIDSDFFSKQQLRDLVGNGD